MEKAKPVEESDPRFLVSCRQAFGYLFWDQMTHCSLRNYGL